MHSWRTLGRRARTGAGTVLFALVAGTLTAGTAAAQPPPDAGRQPSDGPIVYNLVPGEGALVAREDLTRAGATIETRRDAGIRSAEVFIDGRRRPSALMGPTRYLQSVSADIGHLQPGIHTARVVATDSEGRKGGYSWTFAVLPGDFPPDELAPRRELPDLGKGREPRPLPR